MLGGRYVHGVDHLDARYAVCFCECFLVLLKSRVGHFANVAWRVIVDVGWVAHLPHCSVTVLVLVEKVALAAQLWFSHIELGAFLARWCLHARCRVACASLMFAATVHEYVVRKKHGSPRLPPAGQLSVANHNAALLVLVVLQSMLCYTYIMLLSMLDVVQLV